MKKVFAVATSAVSVAIVSSLIGSTIATGDDYDTRHTMNKQRRLRDGHRGVRGETGWMDDSSNNMVHSGSNRGRKRRRRRLGSSTVATTSSSAGIPPLNSFAIQNLAGSWDDVAILEGSLQLPQQEWIPIEGSESNSTDIDNDDDFWLPPIQPRIVGGSEDSDLDPFVMHLRYVQEDGMWKFAGCGGTLISRCHVLTAGHCMVGDRENRTKAVYVNAWRPFSSNTDTTTGKAKPYHVSLIEEDNTFVHPAFNNQGNLNDIAVLSMTKCIPDDRADLFEVMEIADDDFWDKMSSELLYSENPSNDELVAPPLGKTRVAGFGQRDPSDPSVPPALQSVDVSLFGRDDCEEKYNSKLLFESSDLIQPDMYCAGAPTGGKDACLGDSGGPNYFTDPVTSTRTQLGVVSWGIGCAEEGFPGVYTSVAYHYDFIRAAVCEDDRLGDFGAATVDAAASQSKPTAASTLQLCLLDDEPSNNSGGGDEKDPIIVGDNPNDNESPDEDTNQCSEINAACQKDAECCDDLWCNKRDKQCKEVPRQNKGRLTDGTHGGSASKVLRNNGG